MQCFGVPNSWQHSEAPILKRSLNCSLGKCWCWTTSTFHPHIQRTANLWSLREGLGRCHISLSSHCPSCAVPPWESSWWQGQGLLALSCRVSLTTCRGAWRGAGNPTGNERGPAQCPSLKRVFWFDVSESISLTPYGLVWDSRNPLSKCFLRFLYLSYSVSWGLILLFLGYLCHLSIQPGKPSHQVWRGMLLKYK